MPAGTGLGLVAVAFGAADPARLAAFWSHALGAPLAQNGDGSVELASHAKGLAVRFEPLAADQTSRRRLHLDLTTSSEGDQRRTAEALVELGGREVDIGQTPEEGHLVLVDPEDNELCLIEPGNRFLAGCPRIGALNADGTRATGVFWSAVLGYPLVWDQDEETAIRHPDGTGPMITWSGPPLNPKPGRNRLRLVLAPDPGVDLDRAVGAAVALGASVVDRTSGRVELADPDGNEFLIDGER